jgi:hypothetical protein
MNLASPAGKADDLESDGSAERTYRETMSVLGALMYVPSATFQIIQRNFLLWTRLTSHRFFEDAKRGKLTEAQILQHERNLLALGVKFQSLLLGEEVAGGSTREASTPLTSRSSLFSGNLLLASVVRHWLDRVESHTVAAEKQTSDAEGVRVTDELSEASRSMQSAVDRILDALDHLSSFTERQFVVTLLLLLHVQAWSLAVKNERIPMTENGKDFVERMLETPLEESVLEAVRLFDVHLFKAFAVYTPPSTARGTSFWDLQQASEIAQSTQQSLGWNDIMTRLGVRADEFLRLTHELYESICPSLRYNKPLCAKCGRAGHAPERCTFKSCIE